MDKTLKDLLNVLSKALDERELDPETLTKCKDLLTHIIEKAASVKEEGGDRESIKNAIYDLLNKKAGTVSAT
ncbi:MAG: hypothetical protein QXP36_03995 [Conexivisphaerales archaeon]